MIQDKMHLKFCKSAEVLEKRTKFSKFKGKYLVSMNSLKTNGINITVMKYLEKWFDDNIDDIFEKF